MEAAALRKRGRGMRFEAVDPGSILGWRASGVLLVLLLVIVPIEKEEKDNDEKRIGLHFCALPL